MYVAEDSTKETFVEYKAGNKVSEPQCDIHVINDENDETADSSDHEQTARENEPESAACISIKDLSENPSDNNSTSSILDDEEVGNESSDAATVSEKTLTVDQSISKEVHLAASSGSDDDANLSNAEEPSNLRKSRNNSKTSRDNSHDSGIGLSNCALYTADEPNGDAPTTSVQDDSWSTSEEKNHSKISRFTVVCSSATNENEAESSSSAINDADNVDEPGPSSSGINPVIDEDVPSSSNGGATSRRAQRFSSSRRDNPIPLQVVALAEGFGLGDFTTDYSDNEEYSDEEEGRSANRDHSHVIDIDGEGDDSSSTSYNTKTEMMTCLVCFEAFSGKKVIHCYECDLYICLKCMRNHMETKIGDGVIRLYCAGDSCSRLLSDQMISAFCPQSMAIFNKNRIEVENNPRKKTCPNCHKVEVISDLNDLSQRQIKCSACALLWCHACYTPWHSGISCQVYQKDVVGAGKKALKFWAKSKGKETANARKCPSCHFYIERISGCDHMTCNRCNTDFCYKCGLKHRSMGWFGNHYSTYSFLGCKYNLLPKKPVLRIMVRSSAFCGVVIGAPVVAILVVTGALCIIAVSPILIPIIIHRRCKNR